MTAPRLITLYVLSISSALLIAPLLIVERDARLLHHCSDFSPLSILLSLMVALVSIGTVGLLQGMGSRDRLFWYSRTMRRWEDSLRSGEAISSHSLLLHPLMRKQLERGLAGKGLPADAVEHILSFCVSPIALLTHDGRIVLIASGNRASPTLDGPSFVINCDLMSLRSPHTTLPAYSRPFFTYIGVKESITGEGWMKLTPAPHDGLVSWRVIKLHPFSPTIIVLVFSAMVILCRDIRGRGRMTSCSYYHLPNLERAIPMRCMDFMDSSIEGVLALFRNATLGKEYWDVVSGLVALEEEDVGRDVAEALMTRAMRVFKASQSPRLVSFDALSISLERSLVP
jgi:hypothetical protein